MIIQINNDWRLRSDPRQWIIEKRTTRKGRNEWRCIAFHKSLDGAVVGLCRRRIQVMEGTYGPAALIPLCTALDSLRDEVRTALGGFETKPSTYTGKEGM